MALRGVDTLTVITVLAERTTPAVQAIAWKAQRSLCECYRRLQAHGMPKGTVCTAITRELLGFGFIWAIAWEHRHPGSMKRNCSLTRKESR